MGPGGCRLCLDPFAENFSTIDNPELKDQMIKVFYFSIQPKQGYCSGVCQSCSYAISEFYQYSEKVRQNQELLDGNVTNCDSTVDSKITLESIKVEILSDSGLPESIEHACEPKVETSTEEEEEEEEDEGPNSGDDESYEPPPKKLQIKQKQRTAKQELNHLEADEPTKTSNETISETRNQKLHEEDELFNKHFSMICNLCGTSAATFSELAKHFREKHKQYDPYVMCCNKKLIKRFAIRDHIDFHVNPDLLRCEVCGNQYKSRNTLNAHKLHKHSRGDQGSFKCDHCPLTFAQKSALSQHKKRQVKVKCPKCNKVLSCKASLRRHITDQHSGKDRAMVCDTCGRGFLTKHNFNRHIKKHMGIEVPRAQCEICQRWLKSERNLRIHMKYVHTDNLQFQCDICLQMFPHSRAVFLHKFREHTETKHECDLCSKVFNKPLLLKEHRATHTGEVLYSCQYCGAPKKQKTHLYRHIKQHHPAEWAQKKLKVKARVKAAQRKVPS